VNLSLEIIPRIFLENMEKQKQLVGKKYILLYQHWFPLEISNVNNYKPCLDNQKLFLIEK